MIDFDKNRVLKNYQDGDQNKIPYAMNDIEHEHIVSYTLTYDQTKKYKIKFLLYT